MVEVVVTCGNRKAISGGMGTDRPFFLSPKLSYVLFILARDHYYDRKKKSSSRLSGGYAINYDRKKKKDTGGKFSLRAEKKKVPVICLAGVSVFGPNPNPNSF